MNSFSATLKDINGANFSTGITSVEEIQEFYNYDHSTNNIYEISNDMIYGPLIDATFEKTTLICVIDEEEIYIPTSEIPIFNTNKEIRSSSFFTPEQAEDVCNRVKYNISSYYKTWSTAYRSNSKKLIETKEFYYGDIFANLSFEGPFNKNKLFFIQADTLPYKNNSLISIVGYINPDGSIDYDNFGEDSYDYYEMKITLDLKEYGEEEFQELFS